MSDDALATLRTYLNSDNLSFWSILGELTRMSEARRRNLLRPHDEQGFGLNEAEAMNMRARLDRTLGALTVLEIAFQVAVLPTAEPRVKPFNQLKEMFSDSVFSVALDDLLVLFRSEAFLRYVSAYLYFGIRFLAGRLAPPRWMVVDCSGKQLNRKSNARPFALAPPPPLEKVPEHLDEDFVRLVELLKVVDEHSINATFDPSQSEALKFLDGFIPNLGETQSAPAAGQAPATERQHWPQELDRDEDLEWQRFEFWLRGLRPESWQESRFRELTEGIKNWAIAHRDFYWSVQRHSEKDSSAWKPLDKSIRPPGGWIVTSPAAARFGLADMYWIARLLRAEVSANATVTYPHRNWLYLLRFHSGLEGDTEEAQSFQNSLRCAEEILRSAFDFVCDLVQNAVDLTNEKERLAFEFIAAKKPNDVVANWRDVFDEELSEVERERLRREFRPATDAESADFHAVSKPGTANAIPGSIPSASPGPVPANPTPDSRADSSGEGTPPPGSTGGGVGKGPPKPNGWMRRIRTGEQPTHLVGLAFSGGGIRSATFNLGVLQGLQELDLLRQIDFISTVSGGGFIGAWLIANVARTRHWLGRLTSWDESIAHLRRYSSYLSPKTGVLSADTWTMFASWARNAFLIQLTGVAWLLVLLLVAFSVQYIFQAAGASGLVIHGSVPLSGAFAGGLTVVLLVTLLYNLWDDRAVSGSPSALDVPWLRKLSVWIWRLGSEAPRPALGLFSRCLRAILRFFGVPQKRIQKGAAWARKGGQAAQAKWVRRLAVCPAGIGSFLLASLLWADATHRSSLWRKFNDAYTYSGILSAAKTPWAPLIILVFLALFLIAFFTLSHLRNLIVQSKLQIRNLTERLRVNPDDDASREELERFEFYRFRNRVLRVWHSAWISAICVLVLYLELCGILDVFVGWAGKPQAEWNWFAYVFGPPAVLAAFTVTVVIFIGFCGRNSNESVREWWTRYGTWLAIYGIVYFLITGAAVFGPFLTLHLMHLTGSVKGTIKWGSIISWIGTVAGGLFAGKSSKTSGEKSGTKSQLLEILANVGGLLFIVGAVLIVATLLYILLVNISTDCIKCTSVDDYWRNLGEVTTGLMLGALFLVAFCGYLFSLFFEINIFGLNQFYRSRLARCYLGATRWAPGFRKPQPFIKFDGEDDMRLSALSDEFRGPFPILNCALNLAGSSDLSLHTRHSASFSLTPLRCGADRPLVGYAPTRSTAGSFAGGVMLGQAVAISGAAASPNMGYNTSPLVAFLLTMFNVRLGWWFPNPRGPRWKKPGLGFSLYYLVKELFGIADDNNYFLSVSDGGHFENLGIYELVRRRCKVIIAADAECDEQLQFGSLGNVVRICETDFGAKIKIDVGSIRLQAGGLSLAHCSVGTINYSNGSIGYLIYLKSSISGDEPVGIAQYRSIHPSFPHQTTADQFFSEDQFESYRQLGLHVVRQSMRGTQLGDSPVQIAEKLADVLTPSGCTSETFLKHARNLDRIWERFREDPDLQPFLKELMPNSVTAIPLVAPSPLRPNAEVIIGLEMIQLMENVFLDLRLDDFWEHPDNRGWAILFMRWARSGRFREIWSNARRTFGIRFEYFCEARLGLPRDQFTVRV